MRTIGGTSEGSIRRLWLSLATAALLAASLGACTTTQGPAGAAVPVRPAVAAPPGAPSAPVPEYRLNVGDQIDIKFFYNPELNEGLLVPPDGRISLQLAGSMQVTGLTPAELEARLAEAYRPHLQRPQATVILRKYAPQRVFVGGEVVQPAVLVVDGPLTVLQAIFHAGGFKFNAEPGNVLVFRSNAAEQRTDVFVVDLAQQLSPQTGGATCAGSADPKGCETTQGLDYVRLGDMPVRANDLIYVPQTRIGHLAQYIDENVSRILPIYRNLGFSFFYNVRRDASTTVTTQP